MYLKELLLFTEYLNLKALSLYEMTVKYIYHLLIFCASLFYQQTPIDLVKTKLQIQIFSTPTESSSRSASVATIIRRQVTNHGIFSLWQGFSATMIRNIPANAVFFPGNCLSWFLLLPTLIPNLELNHLAWMYVQLSYFQWYNCIHHFTVVIYANTNLLVLSIFINSKWTSEAWNSKQRPEESWEFDNSWEDDFWCMCGTMLLGWDFPPWCHQGQFPYTVCVRISVFECVCVCVYAYVCVCVCVCVLHARKRQFDLMKSDGSYRLHGRLSATSSTTYYLDFILLFSHHF